MASEVEETLKRIQSHRGVEGILIVNNDGVPLKSTLSAEQTTQYASLFSQVINTAAVNTCLGNPVLTPSPPQHQPTSLCTQLSAKSRSVVRSLDATNDLTFLRVRSRKNEIMVAPGMWCDV